MNHSPFPRRSPNGSSADRVAAEIRSKGDALDDPRVVKIVAEYEHALKAGAYPNRSEFINRYPELAAEVAACLDGLDLVYGDAPQFGALGGNGAAAVSPGLEGAPLGDFKIVREIARGGMGVVYEATQLSLGRRVALKVLPFAATIDERHLQRFKLEAQAAALLHHNHIVPVYAVGCERGVHYYAMQLIDGQSLAVVISQLTAEEKNSVATPGISETESLGQAASNGSSAANDNSTPSNHRGQQATDAESQNARSDETHRANANHAGDSTLEVSTAVTAGNSIRSERYVRRAARMIADAADALEHAHQAGVVHRDIKPANLLVDRTGKIWVTDFGLAQIQADMSLTRPGDMLGTLRYMSPEQAGGQPTSLDHRTDVYSLGATLYELLTMRPVFDGETHQELLYQIVHEEAGSLRDKNRAVPNELETIVLKSISKNPADRYQSAAAFAGDLQRFLDHQPILARRPTIIDRARKWSRRHPSVVIAAGLLFVAISLVLLISNRMIAEEQKKTQEALRQEQLRADEAEQSFQQARAAVDALFQISEEELGDGRNATARQRILEVVLSHYEDFIEQRGDDPQSQAELAAVQEEVKRILHELTVLNQSLRLRLIEYASVQAELKFTDAQQAELSTVLDAFRNNEFGMARSQIEELTQEERRQRRVAAAERQQAILEDFLTASQMNRFRQIGVQSMRFYAFKEPEIVDALQLTALQRSQIRALEREDGPRGRFANRGSRNPSGQRGRGQRGRGRSRRDSAENNALIESAVQLLTGEQRAKWDQLVGPPFDGFDNPRLFGGPRRD